MISHDDFNSLSLPQKLLYLYDEIGQLRRAAVVTGAALLDLRTRLDELENRRPNTDA
jgi:hypothetical protein